MTSKIPPDFRDLCHYVVPHSSPLHTDGPFDRRGHWELYTSRRKILSHNLTREEHQISDFFADYDIPYQFYHRAGIFYAPLRWRQALDLCDQFECAVDLKLRPDLANRLAHL